MCLFCHGELWTRKEYTTKRTDALSSSTPVLITVATAAMRLDPSSLLPSSTCTEPILPCSLVSSSTLAITIQDMPRERGDTPAPVNLTALVGAHVAPACTKSVRNDGRANWPNGRKQEIGHMRKSESKATKESCSDEKSLIAAGHRHQAPMIRRRCRGNPALL